MLDPSIFKAYDVRGIWPQQLDADGAYAIGRAYAEHLEPETVAVGRDMRTMAPEIADALVRGLTDSGVEVQYIGEVGTEMLYFAVAHHQLDGGIQVTASHNPKEYIGMKMVKRGARPIGGDSGLRNIRDFAVTAHASPPAPVATPGVRRNLDVSGDFVERVLSCIDVDKIKPLNVVLDAGNGIGGSMFSQIMKHLPITAHTYHFEPDGTFPHHEPNPLLEENRQFIIDRVREHGADLGIAWDGDADRCFFIDDTGEFVPGDFITALIASYTLRAHPGSAILYDVRASWAVADEVGKAGGKAIPSRVGHAFIKERMPKEDAVFAGEVSGHYYFRDFYSVDSGMIPALMLLQMVSESGGKMSDLARPLTSKYWISGEINSTVDDVPMKLQQIKETYSDARITHIDGVSVDYDDWHFNVRPSNTEPLLRLNLEARSKDEMERRRDEVLGLIRSSSTERIGVPQ